MSRDVVFLLNRSEITAGTRGASLGPDAIITAARTNGKNVFSNCLIEEIKDVNYLLDQPTVFKFAKRIDGLQKIYVDLNEKVSSILKNNKFPLLLAADHGSAGGTIAGIKSAFPEKRLGVVWIDAHADIHTPYTTPSGNMHGMPLAIALNEDNQDCKINELSEETITQWESIKNIGGKGPKVHAEDIVYIGVRDTEEQENSIISKLNIKNYTVDEVRSYGVSKVVSEIDQKLSHCDIVYISFDVDSMDPDLTSHGTGTPVKNGITPEEATAILVHFAKNDKTICMEIVEVNPCLDEKVNKMAEVTVDLVESIVTALKN